MKNYLDSSREKRSERGQGLVEFTLMFPLLLLILAGALDLARAYKVYVSITNAAREGARYAASYSGNSQGISDTVTQALQNTGITGFTVQTTCAAYGTSTFDACSASNTNQGDQIQVSVSYPFQLILTEILNMGTITLSNSATMPISK